MQGIRYPTNLMRQLLCAPREIFSSAAVRELEAFGRGTNVRKREGCAVSSLFEVEQLTVKRELLKPSYNFNHARMLAYIRMEPVHTSQAILDRVIKIGISGLLNSSSLYGRPESLRVLTAPPS